MREQLHTILQKLIIKNNIRVLKEELEFQLSSHPSYPSLHALTGVLDHFNIPNLALRLSVNKETFKKLPAFFIANMSIDNGDDLVLVEKKKRKVKITNGGRNKIITEEDFLSQWNGVILAVEKDENIEKTKTRFDVSIIANWIMFSIGVLCIVYFLVTWSNVLVQTHFILSAIGLMLSVFIAKHELGLQSNTANQFCNLSENTSCDVVLNSKGSTIFSFLKLSDVSIVAFATYCLSWLLFMIKGTSGFGILSLTTLIGIPFAAYSLYSQYLIIKKWCPLCLGIATILISQFIIVMLWEDFSSITSFFRLTEIVIFIFSLFITAAVWIILKSLIEKKESFQKIAFTHYKFKRKFLFFKSLYEESDSLVEINYFSQELVFGNKNAEIELVLVTNPLCFFCKKAHQDIEYLLDQSNNSIKVIIRFNVDVSNKDSLLYKVVSGLLYIYHERGEGYALKALKEVYKEGVDLQKWVDSQIYKKTSYFDNLLIDQYEWCKKNAVNFTPALYLNNRLFPSEYDKSDLIYFIDEFIVSQHKLSNVLVS